MEIGQFPHLLRCFCRFCWWLLKVNLHSPVMRSLLVFVNGQNRQKYYTDIHMHWEGFQGGILKLENLNRRIQFIDIDIFSQSSDFLRYENQRFQSLQSITNHHDEHMAQRRSRRPPLFRQQWRCVMCHCGVGDWYRVVNKWDINSVDKYIENKVSLGIPCKRAREVNSTVMCKESTTRISLFIMMIFDIIDCGWEHTCTMCCDFVSAVVFQWRGFLLHFHSLTYTR